jgi:fibronectin type 3 domain-containing protein
VTFTGAPLAPSQLAGSVTASGQITLTWQDNSDNEGGFTVYRSTDGVNFTALGSAKINATSYVDSTVTDGTRYYYRVQAVNGAGRSAYTNVLGITAGPPAAPTNLVAALTASGFVDLTWADNSDNETSFKVLRSLDKVTWTLVTVTGPNVTGFTDTTVAPNTLYYYKVHAVNGAGGSAYTNNVSIDT